jgi:hypothetical protein
MNNMSLKLLWFIFPLTKLVYAYLAYSNRKEVNNSFQMISIMMLIIGFVICMISILLSKIIYKKNFSENKIVKSFLGNSGTDSSMATFTLFAMLLGLAESAALFGLVQFLLTGNLIVGIILFALCFVAWAFNFPRGQNDRTDD